LIFPRHETVGLDGSRLRVHDPVIGDPIPAIQLVLGAPVDRRRNKVKLTEK
jgi:hypothetical protein